MNTSFSSLTCTLFYHSWLSDTAHLPRQEQDQLLVALLRYAAEGEAMPQQFSPAQQAAFNIIQRVIDHNHAKVHQRMARTQRTTSKASVAPLTSSTARAADRNVAEPQALTPPATVGKRTDEADDSTTRAADRNVAEPQPLTPPDAAGKPHAPAPAHAPARASASSQEYKSPECQSPECQSPVKNLSSHSSTAVAANHQNAEIDFFDSPENASPVSPPENASPESASTETTSSPENASPVSPPENAAPENAPPENVPPKAPDKAPAIDTLDRLVHRGYIDRETLRRWWRQQGYRSSADEFYDYYRQRNWCNARGTRIAQWGRAAARWEWRFVRCILPQRLEEQRLSALRAQQAREAAEARASEARARAYEYDQRAARSVKPDEARRLFQLALQQTHGDTNAAINLLKDDQQLARLRAM